MTQILLIGNPNCGKTTLFNALTGGHQSVGNWPGVTTEKKTGRLSAETSIEVIDLPGVYSLAAHSASLSQDEQIATHALMDMDYDCIINVIDACHLERHLYLSSQILELGKPVIFALSMMDIAQQAGISIDIPALQAQLGCPVFSIQAHKNKDLAALEQALKKPPPLAPILVPLPQTLQPLLAQLKAEFIERGATEAFAYFQALRFAEEEKLDERLTKEVLSHELDLDVLLADARYQKIHDLVLVVQDKKNAHSDQITAKLDRIFLHRFWALPIFLFMMYLMFFFAINVGGIFQDFVDLSTDTIFVQGSAWLLQQIHAPHWIIALIAQGLGKGINTTLTFIPILAGMYFFLALLETSGYMARAAFVVDKLMRVLGLPGKAFVPMIVGFGCNVPAIMAARTLDTERERLLTVMMSPFMSCSARLAIYSVFVAAFFPQGGQNIVFSLYLIGILMAVFTGFLLRRTLLQGSVSSLILELPVYHRPSIKALIKETSFRLRVFVLRAGRLIVPVCILLGALNAMTLGGGLNSEEASAQSLLSFIGQALTPLFAPMGIHADNWPATVGLLTGMLAKEVVIGSLNSLYAQVGQIKTLSSFHFWGDLQTAFWTIPQHLTNLGSALGNPIKARASAEVLSDSIYGLMYQRFDGQIGAYAYLLFVSLYIPCVSTMAVIRQEANKNFMWLSVVWSLLIAYAAAVLFYQVARFWDYPSAALIGSIVLVLLLLFLVPYFRRGQHVTSNS